MKRAEEILREACAEAARRETEELSRSMTPGDAREADRAFQEHRPRALALIRRKAGGERPWRRYLAAAACLAALAGGLYLLNRQPPDPVLTDRPPAGVTVRPYYTDAPTEAPVPTVKPSPAPTETPIITEKPTETPTPAPTETPAPTASPAPTAEPEPAETAAPALARPEGWTGLYFPQALPAEDGLLALEQEAGRHTARFAAAIFTEYDGIRALAKPEERAEMRYVALENGTIALRTELDGVVTLAWDQDGRTLTVVTEGGDPVPIADSVKKVSAE